MTTLILSDEDREMIVRALARWDDLDANALMEQLQEYDSWSWQAKGAPVRLVSSGTGKFKPLRVEIEELARRITGLEAAADRTAPEHGMLDTRITHLGSRVTTLEEGVSRLRPTGREMEPILDRLDVLESRVNKVLEAFGVVGATLKGS